MAKQYVKRKSGRIGLALLASTAICATVATMLPATAQQMAQTFTYALPAGPLGATISRFGDQSNLQILYPADLVRGKTSPGVSGTVAPQEALSRLLAGTDLAYRFTTADTVTIIDPNASAHFAVDEDTAMLGTITVQGQGATTEGTGSYTTDSMNTATKLPLSIRETPQSVSVVTQQQMQDKNYGTLDEALQDAPGIIAAQGFGDTRWEYFARGDAISNIQFDGVASPINNFTRDVLVQDNLAIYDRIEIIRGATGLTEGSGNPSASVNLVRKRPTNTPQYSLASSVSSYGNVYGTFDASGPLNDNKSVRGRFVAYGGGGDGYRDYNTQKNLTLYGVVDADITENTTVSVGLSYQREDTNGYTWGGLPTRVDGSFYGFTAKSFLGSDWEYLKKRQKTAYLDVEHRFDNDWKLNASVRAIWADSDMLSSFIWRFGESVRKNDRLYDYNDDQLSADVHVSGPAELFGRSHDFVLGISTMREKHSYVGGSSPFYEIDPATWDPTSVPKPDITVGSFRGDLDQRETGIYASSRLNISDPFKILVGGRLSWYKNNDMYSDDEYRENGRFIPYLGAVYDLDDTYSIYASYTGIFKPQLAYGRDGKLLDPVKGDNKELGLKAEFLGGNLNASVAVFETMQKGLAVQLDDVSNCNPAAYTCYEAADKIRTRGIEFDVSGEVTDGLNVGFGYTFSQSEYVAGADAGEKYNTNKMPPHLLKLHAAYNLPGAWSNWTVGGSIRTQSKTYYQGTNFRIEQPAYAVVDLMTRYALNDRTEMQVNVNNLFDKNYYSSISGLTSYGNFMGASREVVLSVRHRF